MTRAKTGRTTQPLSVSAASAAYDRIEVLWRQADEWCEALDLAFRKVLDAHTAVGQRLGDIFAAMGRGERPTQDIGALWARENELRAQLEGVMACRRAAARRRNLVYADLKAADRAHEQAVARARRAAA